MLSLHRRQEDPGKFTNACRVPEVILHEDFNTPSPFAVLKPHAFGNDHLRIKGQLVARPRCDEVQVATNGPQEYFCPSEGVKFI